MLCGCNSARGFEFLNSVDMITKVEIVMTMDPQKSDSNNKGILPLSTTVLKELSKKEQEDFLIKIQNIACDVIYNDPTVLEAGNIAFRINYSNGDYELITAYAQASYKSNIYKRTGHFGFDKEEFDELINAYYRPQ